MRIPIIVQNNQGVEEWALIELQGSITSKTQSFDSQTIGPLTIEDNIGTLVIGNHKLTGVVSSLKNPLIVVQKGTTDGLPVIAVIRRRILFQDRPEILFPKSIF